MGVGGQHNNPAALPAGKRPGTYCTGGERGQGQSGRVQEVSLPTGIWSKDCPAPSESLFILISIFLLYPFILTSSVESLL